MKEVYCFYAAQMFADPSDLDALKVVEAIKVGQTVGLDFWNPEDVPSTEFQRNRLRQILGIKT